MYVGFCKGGATENWTAAGYGRGSLSLACQHAVSLQAAGSFAKGVEQIDGLQLAGTPAMTVVAFRAAKPRKLNIYALNDLMSQRGWHLSALQLPPALHMCFTGQHASVVDALLKVGALLHHCM